MTHNYSRMDLISRLPEVLLPYLCSFGTLEMDIAMACVNRKWRRVIHKYGDISMLRPSLWLFLPFAPPSILLLLC